MPQNAYPEKPSVPYQATTVAMPDVIGHLAAMAIPTEVKRTTYVIFRNESGNGSHGINNNYIGAQADGGRWPPQWDSRIVGTVTQRENQTNVERIFVAFAAWTDSVEFLADRVTARGLFVGGETHQVLTMTISTPDDLARAYQKEWVKGSPTAEPTPAEAASFLSMYGQAETHFP